jgi:hypothetical protein
LSAWLAAAALLTTALTLAAPALAQSFGGNGGKGSGTAGTGGG